MSRNLGSILFLLLTFALAVDAKVTLLEKSRGKTTVQYSCESYVLDTITDSQGTYVKVKLANGGAILSEGNPELPRIAQALQVDNQRKMQVSVINSSYVEYQNIEIRPSKGNLNRAISPEKVRARKAKSYSVDAFWPAQVTTLGDPYIVRDARGQSILFNVVQYNPVTKVLRVYREITAEVTATAEKDTRNTLSETRTTTKSAAFENIKKSLFINYETSRYTPLEEVGNMLIISHPDFMLEMEPFVDWKNKKGIPTQMVSVERVGKTSEEIKAYIANYYNKKGLTFVLLVGDHAQIPTHKTKQGYYSDHYYGNLKGSDSYVEVIIGRFSGESTADITTQVQRSIEYEQSTKSDTWLNSGVGVASDEGSDPSDAEHMHAIQQQLLDYRYTKVDELYDGSAGWSDPSGDATSDQIKEAFNDGRGLFNYVGHGYIGGLNSSNFSNSVVKSLNNSGKMPIGWFVACSAGDFAFNECFGEACLRSRNSEGKPVGFTACLTSTITQPWVPPMKGQNEMNALLVEAYEDNVKRTYGGLSVNGIMKMLDIHGADAEPTAETWTIFGDPSLLVIAGTPEEMTVTHATEITMGDESFTVNCNKEGALVTLAADGTILGSANVESGACEVVLNKPLATADANVSVMVTLFNHENYEGEVTVKKGSAAFLRLKSFDIAGVDTESISFGDTIDLNLVLTNLSSTTANNVVAKLKSLTNKVSVLSDDNEIGDMTEGDKSITEAFTVTADHFIENNTEALFELTVEQNSSATLVDTIMLYCDAPVLAIDEMKFKSGNPLPGEEDTLLVSVSNGGHAALKEVTLSVSSLHEGLSIDLTGLESIDLNGGSEGNFAISVTIDADIIKGTMVELYATLSSQAKSVYKKQSVELGIPLTAHYKLDFERGDDFDITFSPWDARDYDGKKTQGLNSTTWKNEGEPMALIQINPEATLPSIAGYFKPHGGKRYGGTFCNWDEANNDWIISPQIELGGNSSFSMWVHAYDDRYGADRFQVRISITDDDTTSFATLLTDSIVHSDDTVWFEKTVDLSAYNNQKVYVAVHFISNYRDNDAFWSAVDDIVIKTDKGGDVLQIVSLPDEKASVNKRYSYSVQTISEDLGGKTIGLTCVEKPSWLVFYDNENGTALLTGTPSEFDLGDHDIELIADNGVVQDTQKVTITVVEESFEITSEPEKSVLENEKYSYEVSCETSLQGASFSYFLYAPEAAWLSLEQKIDGTVELVGTPGSEDIGTSKVVLSVSNGDKIISQKFDLQVKKGSAVIDFTDDPKELAKLQICPNPYVPSDEKLKVLYKSDFSGRFRVTLHDAVGNTITASEGELAKGVNNILSWEGKNRNYMTVFSGTYVLILSVEKPDGTVVHIRKTVGIRK